MVGKFGKKRNKKNKMNTAAGETAFSVAFISDRLNNGLKRIFVEMVEMGVPRQAQINYMEGAYRLF